ncbi:LysR family transcriptional regulator (plasmid) [Pseudomonas silvicola]|nr:LysR family transcriptional regulator [Pseudomonas silvicola]
MCSWWFCCINYRKSIILKASFFALTDDLKATQRKACQHRLFIYIDQIARSGSIRKAAERLHFASAINRQLIALEEELGTPLFQRLPRKMVLTAAGEALIHHVRQSFKEIEIAQMKIEELKGLRRGEVTVE